MSATGCTSLESNPARCSTSGGSTRPPPRRRPLPTWTGTEWPTGSTPARSPAACTVSTSRRARRSRAVVSRRPPGRRGGCSRPADSRSAIHRRWCPCLRPARCCSPSARARSSTRRRRGNRPPAGSSPSSTRDRQRRSRPWSLSLDPAEELASPPLAAAGLLTFLTFKPSGLDAGEVRRYSLWLRSGEALGGGPRAFVVDAGVPRPATDFGSPTRIEVDHPGRYTVPLSSREEREIEVLRAAMPRRCRFGSVRVRLEAEGRSGGPLRLAVLPVCRVEMDWFGG